MRYYYCLLLCCSVESGICRLRRGASSAPIDELMLASPVALVRDMLRVFSPRVPIGIIYCGCSSTTISVYKYAYMHTSTEYCT